MADKSLDGKKIAVLVESQYIAAEIKCYLERFASYGAEVHLMFRLWGQPKQTFVSEVEEAGRTPETLDVSIDFMQVKLDAYAAVIMAANYTSVRLRWNEAAATSPNAVEMARIAPAVYFFRQAMQNRRIIKGAPCHGLWLLTPSPDYLAERRVTCNPVVLADVLNAGAFYVPAPAGSDWHRHVVVDGDLATNMSALGSNGEPVGTEVFVDTVRDAILNPPAQAGRRESAAAAPVTPGQRRVLILLSEWGYWGEELVGPLGEFDRVGYEVEFCTPNGGRPNAIPSSMDPDFFYPPPQRSVTSPEMAARTRDRRSLDAAGRAPR